MRLSSATMNRIEPNTRSIQWDAAIADSLSLKVIPTALGHGHPIEQCGTRRGRTARIARHIALKTHLTSRTNHRKQ